MTDKKPTRSKEAQKILEQAKKNLQLRPVVSDKDFMAETEVSDEKYKRGMTLPGAK